jgi:ketosteroid isomerase-like protein
VTRSATSFRLAVAVVVAASLAGCGSSYEGPQLTAVVDPALAAWEAAYDSAELEQVVEVFTPDGVFFTTGDFEELAAKPELVRGRLGPDGQEFVRRFRIHAGDDLSVSDAVQVGERAIAFRWAWQDFAAGTGTMAVRDGRLAAVVLTVAPTLSVPDEIDPLLDDFVGAASTGDVERVRALFHEDFVFTTVAVGHAAYHDPADAAQALVDGSQLATWIGDHDGEQLGIRDPVQVGEGIAFAWGWDGGDAGTGVMDVVDGRIESVVLTDAGVAIPRAEPTSS